MQTTGAGWKRAGNRIAYIENTLETEGGSSYYTLTFTLQFPHDSDVCYLSHCIPYTYTDLSVFLAELTSNHASIVQMSTLCTTLCGNKCPLITVTNFSSPVAEIAQRRSIVVSSRVHPGETCASWAVQVIPTCSYPFSRICTYTPVQPPMSSPQNSQKLHPSLRNISQESPKQQGFLEYLCGQTPRARILRDNFVFKVVPMLNPDGVIEGNYRCSMAGSDLNRQWSNPDPILHPTVSALKNLLKLCKSQASSIFCSVKCKTVDENSPCAKNHKCGESQNAHQLARLKITTILRNPSPSSRFCIPLSFESLTLNRGGWASSATLLFNPYSLKS